MEADTQIDRCEKQKSCMHIYIAAGGFEREQDN